MFAAARGGTFFLDEIGEMSPATQVKLLRVLQEREAIPVGGTGAIPVDVRVVAATNRDLEEDIKRGRFRTDLYYRLNVIAIHLPPLRDRREDVPIFVTEFLKKIAQEQGEPPKRLSPEALEAVIVYDWPGNVRELENAIERAVVLGASDMILPEDLPEAVLESGACEPSTPGAANSYQEALLEAKRRVIRAALERAGGVFTEAAKLLDIHPNYLHRLVRSLRLR